MNDRQTDHNIVKYKKKKQLHFISAVFLLILIYLIAQICLFLNRDSVRVFTLGNEVENTLLHNYRGVITRDEQVMHTTGSGYVNYYVREGRRIGVGSIVYTTDESGEFSRMLAQTYTDGTYLPEQTLTELRQKLISVSKTGVYKDFSSVYDEQTELSAKVSDAFLLTASEKLQSDVSGDSPVGVRSGQSGYILFRTDGMEGLTPEQVTRDTFREENRKISVYFSGESRPAGSFAYKIVEDDSFCITFPISPEDAKQYRDRKYLNIELISLGVTVNGAFSIHTSADGMTLATVSLAKYGSSYLTDRYIDFKIAETPVNGYKIPVSSVLTKDFFVIPKEYIRKDAAGQVAGIVRESYRPGTGEELLSIAIYSETDSNYYISCSGLQIGDYLIGESPSERYLVSIVATLDGAYNVNRGYCIFRQVEILGLSTDENYYIIRTDTRFGLSANDRIIQNAELVVENQIIN